MMTPEQQETARAVYRDAERQFGKIGVPPRGVVGLPVAYSTGAHQVDSKVAATVIIVLHPTHETTSGRHAWHRTIEDACRCFGALGDGFSQTADAGSWLP
jgi:hypothetical protein